MTTTQLTVEPGSIMCFARACGDGNPAFDVTPARLVHAIFTERGQVQPVGERALARAIESFMNQARKGNPDRT